MENATDVPSLSTFLDIFNDTVKTWSTCHPWAITDFAVEFLFYLCMALLLFYLYVILMIIRKRLTSGHFSGPFYNCVLLLSLGDIGILLTCSRATIPPCALGTVAVRYLAWESLSVFCVDLIYGVNLVIATVRLNAVMGVFEKKKLATRLLNGFLIGEFVWALLQSILYFNGYVKRIWFVDVEYNQIFLFPFNYFRTQFNMAQLGLTFVIYCLAFIKLRQVTLSAKSRSQQNRFMFLAFLIFICELFFIYCSDWIGYEWGIGDDIFNAHLSYFGRPTATGITPVFYILFSSEVRQACGFSWKQKEPSISSIGQSQTTSNRRYFMFTTSKNK